MLLHAKYNVSLPTFAAGWSELQTDANGRLITVPGIPSGDASTAPSAPNQVFNGTNWDRQREPTADGQAVTGVAAAGNQTFNGSTWDRQRGNQDVSVVSSAAQTASGTSGTVTNYNSRGVNIGVNVTAVAGTTPTLQPIIEGFDNASGTWYTLLTGPTITATGFTLLQVYPGIAAVANLAAGSALPRQWRVRWVIGGTTPSFTFSVGASVIV